MNNLIIKCLYSILRILDRKIVAISGWNQYLKAFRDISTKHSDLRIDMEKYNRKKKTSLREKLNFWKQKKYYAFVGASRLLVIKLLLHFEKDSTESIIVQQFKNSKEQTVKIGMERAIKPSDKILGRYSE